MHKELLNKFKHKLVNLNKLKKIDKKNTILCHGVFDVVHPGHIRHLIYAKSKNKILIVSITADKFIEKGKYRPHVPQNMRALNLAALEIVDFVIIDNNKTPIKLIKELKPAFFAKGFEYSSKLPKSTLDEKKTVEEYGGKLIFTPGDIVYSSTKIINQTLPDLSLEKLSLLMAENEISFQDLKDTLKEFNKLKVHVVGDTIIDTYTKTSFIGGQTKTPTFSVLYDKHTDYVGGAGIVSRHLASAGAKVNFSTVAGRDKYVKFIKKIINNDKINLNLVIDPTRPTTNKNVIISGNYRLLKLDSLDNSPVSSDIVNQLSKYIKNVKSDAIIFSDFRHGIFNKDNIPKYIKNIKKGVFKVADSQVASRWGNITEFKEFDLITPNEREARFALADQDSTVTSLSDSLVDKSNCNYLIMKLSERGVFCMEKVTKKNKVFFALDSFADKVVDPVGAGDALLAYSTLSFLISKSILISSIIGSIAAGCECAFDGNIPVNRDIVLDKITQLEKQIK